MHYEKTGVKFNKQMDIIYSFRREIIELRMVAQGVLQSWPGMKT